MGEYSVMSVMTSLFFTFDQLIVIIVHDSVLCAQSVVLKQTVKLSSDN